MKLNIQTTTIASVALLCFMLLSVWMIKLYIDEERSRDLQRWQDRLSIIADTKKRSIEQWLGAQIDNMQELASNPLLQIYLSLGQDEGHDSEVLQGQVSHLRNLVQATARRAGVFRRAGAINANTTTDNRDGIAVIGADGELRMSTRGFPAISQHTSKAISRAFRNNRIIVYGIFADDRGDPRLALVLPVKPVQQSTSSDVRGAVIALINPQDNLYDVVSEQWLTTSSDESSLVIGDEFSTTYISPLQGKFELFHQVPMANVENAANYARQNVADFAMKSNYRSSSVLVTSRNIAKTQWLLVQSIDADEALSESSAHREFIFTVFMLVVFLLTITFIAVWRHATSVQLRNVTDRLSARTDLLNAVTDSINDKLLLLDHDDRLVFINQSLAEETSTEVADIRGKALNHVFSSETSEKLLALAQDQNTNEVCELEVAGNHNIYHVAVATLNTGQYRTSRLFVLHDITHLQEVQQKHHRLLEGIIATLVRVTDMHDPHCAHHSERTREVAISIAQAMHLGEEQVQTLGMASMLANIGKLNLPKELLTKMEPLTEQEAAMMHDSIDHTVNILKSLDFDGPVVEVVRQKNEYLDGSGYPAHKSGDDIRMESRILAVANAFVAMSSSRAYREGKPVHEVLDKLYEEAGSRYDRSVVAALMHVAESHGDWSEWQTVKDL